MHLRKRSVKLTSLQQVDEHEPEDSAQKEIGIRDLLLAGVVDRLCLTDAMARLPQGYRLIFVLHDVQGFEHHEIAEQLRCSIGNSKSQLHKARMRLRKLLTEPEPAQARQKPERFVPVDGRPTRALKFLRGRRASRRLKLCTSEL
jgi:RNA polymerase sigma-70 factor (ECF subfamily)